MTLKQRATDILVALKKEYPEAACTLDFANPFQLAVATILSAQCTDRRVNMVTGPLFETFPDPRAFADAPLEDIEQAVKSTGFYHNKAKNIQAFSRLLLENYNGILPQTLEELIMFPGIGRKTANVVLSNAFGIVSGFVVDTHVFRLSHRLGLSKGTTPEKVENDLVKLFPREEWSDTSHRLILLGRGPCTARKPNCSDCFMAKHCLSGTTGKIIL